MYSKDIVHLSYVHVLMYVTIEYILETINNLLNSSKKLVFLKTLIKSL